MKKLMVALAAVASAFGLYATEPIQTDGFEGTWEAAGWDVSDATFATQAVYQTSEVKYSGEQPQSFTTVGDSYVELKTELKLDKAVVWANTEEVKTIGEGIYFDGLVRFEDCDETNALPFAVDGANKLAVYTYLDSDNEAEGSHLFVAAGHFDGENWSTKYYDCGKLAIYDHDADSGFDRVTIRAIGDISAGGDTNPGFVVFVNGNNAQYVDTDKEGIGTLALTSTAGAWNSKRSLFPSLVQNQNVENLSTLTAVAFTGHGSIDNVVLTREQPTFAQDSFFTLSVADDQPITGYQYSIDGGATWTPAVDGVAAIALNGEAMTVQVKGFTFDESDYEEWAVVQPDNITGVTVTKTQDGFSFAVAKTADKPAIAFTAKDGAARITIEGGDSYATFAEAIANLPASGDVTLTLNAGIRVGTKLLEDTPVTEALFNTGCNVTLDLNGQTISGTATDYAGYVIQATAGLTIIDGVGTGKIETNGEAGQYVGVVFNKAGTLAISGGTFDGLVKSSGTSSISGGSLLASANAEPDKEDGLTLADGYQATEKDNYWVVSEKPYATIDLTATHATVSGITPDQKIYEGDELEFTAEADENYDAPVVTIGEDQQEPRESYTYTVTAADVEAKTLAISVVASAHEFTITYYNDDSEDNPTVFTTEKYSVETRETQKLNAGVKTGYTFNGWVDDNGPAADGDEVTYLNDKAKDIDLYGSWTEIPTDVAITLPEVLPTGVESLVVSQKVEDVWAEVKDGKIGIGNEYVVIANPAEGYKVENPIVEGTAEADIVVTENDFDGKITQIVYVAQINDDPTKKYESLKAAVEAAEGGDTINILANCDVPETICFYNTGTNAENQITLKNDYHVELTTAGNYSFYIVNANVKVTGTGMFSKTNGVASAFVVGSSEKPGLNGRPAKLGYGILDFEGNLTGGIEELSGPTDYSDAPSGMIKVEAGFCNFVGGSVINWRSNIKNGAYQGKCVSASYKKYTDIDHDITNDFEYVGVVTIQAGTFRANTPLERDEGATLKIIGKDNTAKVRPLDDTRELDYSAFCEPGYTFLKVADDQDPDYQWYKIGMNTFSITVTDGEAAQGAADPAEFTVETEFPLTVTLTKPTAPEGKEFDSWSANVGNIDDAKSTLTIDAFPNKDVVVTVVWKDAASEPVIPGEDIDIPTGKDINDINTNDAVKAELLKAPDDIPTTPAYRALFDAVEGSEAGKVAFVLNSDGTNAVVAAETAADTTVLDAALDADAVTATVENPLVGFYYSLKQNADVTKLGFKEATDKNKLGGKDTIQFTLEKGEASEFYQMIVTPAPVK